MSKPELTADDWAEIYCALLSKRESPTVAGDDDIAIEWQNHLDEIIDKIGEDGLNMLGDDDAISISWTVGDVQDVRGDLSDDDAREVLHSLARSHDASIGINWVVIESTADFMFPKAESE